MSGKRAEKKRPAPVRTGRGPVARPALKKNAGRIAVIGGGAGGLMAACTAAERGAEVLLLEKEERVGKKLLRTGNGRCNLTNLGVSPEGYNRPDFVSPLLEKMGPARLLEHFASLGLWTEPDAEGRVYPVSGAAASVLEVLRLACHERGVTEKTGFTVTGLHREGDGFILLTEPGGEMLSASRVILATGGGTRLHEALGHETAPFSPVLCPIRTDTEGIRGLSGLRVRCRGTLLDERGRPLSSEEGELLFRDYGVSGIMAFELSRSIGAGGKKTLSLDLLPTRSAYALREEFSRRTSRGLRGEALFTGIFRRVLAQALLRRAGSEEPEALAYIVKDFRLGVKGPGEVSQAQLTRGGARTEGFSPLTLESRRVRGFYAVGEALDVDGRCGGYNLHWAFASGLAAGKHASGGGLL